jgi:hypothetical protein
MGFQLPRGLLHPASPGDGAICCGGSHDVLPIPPPACCCIRHPQVMEPFAAKIHMIFFQSLPPAVYCIRRTCNVLPLGRGWEHMSASTFPRTRHPLLLLHPPLPPPPSERREQRCIWCDATEQHGTKNADKTPLPSRTKLRYFCNHNETTHNNTVTADKTPLPPRTCPRYFSCFQTCKNLTPH